jgi:hypothetical protein
MDQNEDNSPPDPAALAEIARVRGLTERDEAAHKALSWATLKDYEIHVGISLEVPDPVGDDTHEVRYWESAKSIPFIAFTNELYDWFAQTISTRSSSGALPEGMPASGDEMEAHIQRIGDGAHIRFICMPPRIQEGQNR